MFKWSLKLGNIVCLMLYSKDDTGFTNSKDDTY